MIATGTAVLIGAGISAIGAGAAAKMSSDANKHAADTQGESTSAALDFSKQQEAERRREWDTQQQASRDAWTARQQMMTPFLAGGQSVLQKYGINTPAPSMPASLSAPMPAGGGPAGTSSVPGPAMPNVPGVSVQPLTPTAVPAPQAVPQSSTVGSLMDPSTQAPSGPQTASAPAAWTDWNKYLGGLNA